MTGTRVTRPKQSKPVTSRNFQITLPADSIPEDSGKTRLNDASICLSATAPWYVSARIGVRIAMPEAMIALANVMTRIRIQTIGGLDPKPVMVLTFRPQGGVNLAVGEFGDIEAAYARFRDRAAPDCGPVSSRCPGRPSQPVFGRKARPETALRRNGCPGEIRVEEPDPAWLCHRSISRGSSRSSSFRPGPAIAAPYPDPA